MSEVATLGDRGDNSTIATQSVAEEPAEQSGELQNAPEQRLDGDDNLENDTIEAQEQNPDTASTPSSIFKFDAAPQQITGAWATFEHCAGNFLKGCKWSPDGTCLLSNSEDGRLRIFNLPPGIYSGDYSHLGDLPPALTVDEGELVYDYCWYPAMNSAQPDTCLLASSARGHPVHLWDAYQGQLRSTYRVYDHLDEMVTPLSLCFSLDGGKLYCGLNKSLAVFETGRPGRDCERRSTVEGKTKQAGIISCIAVNPADPNMYATGSYSKSVGIYSERNGQCQLLLQGQQGGITHLKFSPDGGRVYSGGRRDGEILCWDLRRPGAVLHSLPRRAPTNQRLYFDLDPAGRYLASGHQDGQVSVWEVAPPDQGVLPPDQGVAPPDQGMPEGGVEEEAVLEPLCTYAAHHDAVNGVSFHPTLPLLATASGQRTARPANRTATSSSEEEEDSSSDEDTLSQGEDNSLRIWYC